MLCIIISIGFAACNHSSAQSQKDTVLRPSHTSHKSNPLSPNSFSVQVHNFSANFSFLVNLLTFPNFPNGTKCSPASQTSLYHSPHNKCWCMPFLNRNIHSKAFNIFAKNPLNGAATLAFLLRIVYILPGCNAKLHISPSSSSIHWGRTGG